MPFQEHTQNYNKILGNNLCNKLNQKGYKSLYCENKTVACQAVLELIPLNASVGIPGSVTIREIGVIPILETRKNAVYHHWDPSLKQEEKKQRFIDEMMADCFLTSCNAITRNAELVNIDGTGNRVAAMCWAPGKIIYVIGINKVCDTLESAISRIKNCSTPQNSLRLNYETPCTKTGHCVNCDSPNRVCRVTTIHERAPQGRECHVILVGESLGF